MSHHQLEKHCAAGNLEKVKEALAKGANVNLRRQYDNFTPLMIAAFNGHTSIVELLLSNPDVDVNAIDDESSTALTHAVSYNRLGAVELLLADPRVDVNCRTDMFGMTPLHIAAHIGFVRAVEMLLDKSRVDVNAQCERVLTTPLSWAVMNSVSEDVRQVVQLLLADPRVDVNCQEDTGLTPLHIAVSKNIIRTVEMLLAHPDIDLNKESHDGLTPLAKALDRNRLDAAELILANLRVDVNKAASTGGLPLLHFAVGKTNALNVVELILSHPSLVDVNKKYYGVTALQLAVSQKDVEALKLLIGHPGVDLEVEGISVNEVLIRYCLLKAITVY